MLELNIHVHLIKQKRAYSGIFRVCLIMVTYGYIVLQFFFFFFHSLF